MPESKESIWFESPSVEAINTLAQSSMVAHLGIVCEEVNDSSLVLSMPVDERTTQPYGVLHGGASVALAETASSLGAIHCVDRSQSTCFGIEINANHVRSVRSGRVIATASPLHIGRSTHVWDVRIENEDGQLVCISRVTLAVVPSKK